MKTYNIIKGIASLALSFCLAGTANAQSWGLEETQLTTAGGRDTLRIQLTGNDFTFTSFQTDVTLPDGLMITGSPFLGTGMANGHTISWEAQTEENTYRCVAYSGNNNDMLETNGTLLCIPVQLTTSFKSGNVTVTKGLLANKKSETKPVGDLNTTVNATIIKKDIVVNVSGLEQKFNDTIPAEITYTTVPEGLKLTVGYYMNAECTQEATADSLKQEGTFYVKVSYAGDEDYNAFEQIYTMVLTAKVDIAMDQITPPTASPLIEGQLLSTSLLTGGSAKETEVSGGLPIPGEFVWTNGNTAVEATADSVEYSVTFIPQNQAYYNAAYLNVKVAITPTYLITALSGDGGTVAITGQTENNLYTKDQKLTLTAIPDENYELAGWTMNGTPDGKELERTVTAKEDATYFATFAPITHAITLTTEGEGSLRVTNNGSTVSNGSSVHQGTTLQVIAEPINGWELSSLTVNSAALQGNQLKVTAATTIKAVFARKPAANYTVTVADAENGRTLVYKADGSLVPSGSSVTAGTQIRIITLPNAGYVLNTITPQVEGLYTVTGDVTITPSFKKQQFTIKAETKNSDNSTGETAGTITVDKQSAEYGETITFTVEKATPLYVLVNGKEVSLNGNQGSATVTGNMTITAVFDHRVDIEKRYIMFPHQEFYYSGVSRTFVPFASQTYAGFSFDVRYKRRLDGNEDPLTIPEDTLDRAVDAGTYTVILDRPADNLYNQFHAEFRDGLIIKQSTIAVTEAPGSEPNSQPKTRPSEGVKIAKDESFTTNNLTKYDIDPESSIVKNNYKGTVYYYYSGNNEDAISINTGTYSLLRNTGETQGYLRITNGGLPYEAPNGTVSIPKGIEVSVEAIPADGYRFTQWGDGETKNPREVTVTDGIDNKFQPTFVAKGEYTNIALTSTSSDYTGAAQTVSLTKEDDYCQISFFSDEDCKQPAILKNVGTYYVRVYRPADTEYNETTKIISYTINGISLDSESITAPTATAIMAGETLSMAELMGGHAGIVPGTFAWTNPNQTVTASGKYEVTFTPTGPNYKPTTLEVEVNVLGTNGEVIEQPDDSGDTDDSSDPSDPNRPSRPTDIEAIEAETVITAEHQTIQIRPAQPMTVSIVNMSGALLYHGDIADITSIPVGTSGVYIVKMNAGETEIVKKINVR